MLKNVYNLTDNNELSYFENLKKDDKFEDISQ